MLGGAEWEQVANYEDIMVDWITENPTTASEASGHGVKEWKFFLKEGKTQKKINGVKALGYSPAVRYRYVQPETSDSDYFSRFLDYASDKLGEIEGPAEDVVLSEFVPPSEEDLYEHIAGFGESLGGVIPPLPVDYALLFRELSSVEQWGGTITDYLNPALLPKIKVPSRTSPGIRWKRLGYKTKRQALVPAVIEASRALNRIVGLGECYTVPPCGVAGRGKRVSMERDSKSTGPRKEGRLIVMPDLVRHLLGPLGSIPVMSHLKKMDHSGGGVMLGMGPFQEHYSDIAEWAKGAVSFIFIDFRKFDHRIPREVPRQVMKYIQSKFEDCPGSRAYWKSEFTQLVDTVIAMPNGDVYQKSRGVASGDPWTSIVDSYANWIMLKWIFHQLGLEVKIWTFGDDSVVAVHNKVVNQKDMDSVKEVAWNEFGMNIADDKSYFTDHLVDIDDDPEEQSSGSFLSLYFLATPFGIRPTRPLQDLYELMLKPERNGGTVEWEVVRTSMAYLTFFYNEKARMVLDMYWEWLHETYQIPELSGTYKDLELLRQMDIPWNSFKIEWLNHLPMAAEVELMYKYGHTGFYPPLLWGAWYSKHDRDVSGNTLVDPKLRDPG
ncbi:RNA-dependent RNA polymerase [Fusarium culmorum virus 1]|uniref:RNA-dependent RNA polymerase n=1 Tax=Fusarium culmorum virus 1 TaxID=2711135 RepID=A0A6C0WZ92_9VIRU|nr:RNA-dependent RNA polymerase [Fusarium culmorum virus 1]